MIAIIVDNLDIGGIQRFALDECYFLREANEKYCLLVLSSKKSYSIVDVDQDFSHFKQLNIIYLGDNLINKIRKLYKFFLTNKLQIFVSHSVSGTFLVRIISITLFRNYKIYLWIHQAITLSNPLQAFKRILYSNFATKLFFGAKHFELEWLDYINGSFFLKMFFYRKTYFSRLGVYLPRILSIKFKEKHFDIRESIIFTSRLTKWKGFDKFLDIANSDAFKRFNHIVLTSSAWHNIETETIKHPDLTVLINSSPAILRSLSRAVHLYPTVYGIRTKYPQSIGLNVLEFLALGIPSLISVETFETYPELKDCILIKTCEWENPEEVKEKIITLINLDLSEKLKASAMLREVISIEKHMDLILER